MRADSTLTVIGQGRLKKSQSCTDGILTCDRPHQLGATPCTDEEFLSLSVGADVVKPINCEIATLLGKCDCNEFWVGIFSPEICALNPGLINRFVASLATFCPLSPLKWRKADSTNPSLFSHNHLLNFKQVPTVLIAIRALCPLCHRNWQLIC